ncbi:MAG: glucose-1-phosphate cytidylyltransferase [Candidatus Brocadia sp. WS118]|nr:MAG: glucose-1-phosphate cytidylyltransferase [Candidatus Brocadia sp. WS118]
MKAVILAGGFGTRLTEETAVRPKPMIEIGGKPILWHIMNIYSAHGINEFIIAAGYKAEIIKEYFLNFYAINNDITVDLNTGNTTIHNNGKQPGWKVHVVDTGLYTQTGGRLKRLKRWLENDNAFMFTYGDGVADVDVNALLKFHISHGKLATITTVRAPERFGRISFNGDQITKFHEKPEAVEGWINGGFFILNPKAIEYVESDEAIWERNPIEKLAHDHQLMGYRHYGFWSCMDTLKEKNLLEDLWNSGKAPWKIW